jgi:hypothetical protein
MAELHREDDRLGILNQLEARRTETFPPATNDKLLSFRFPALPSKKVIAGFDSK